MVDIVALASGTMFGAGRKGEGPTPNRDTGASAGWRVMFSVVVCVSWGAGIAFAGVCPLARCCWVLLILKTVMRGLDTEQVACSRLLQGEPGLAGCSRLRSLPRDSPPHQALRALLW